MSGQRSSGCTLKDLLEAHDGHLANARRHTCSKCRVGRSLLGRYFGLGREADSITDQDAVLYRQWLVTQGGLRETTVRCLCRQANQVFKTGVRQGLIHGNPFIKEVVGAQQKPRGTEGEVEP